MKTKRDEVTNGRAELRKRGRGLTFSTPHASAGATAGPGRRTRGFTLIEVLVVVAIIALLIAILLPSLKAARDQAKLTTCKANAKQIGTIMATYQAQFRDFVPVVFNYDHQLKFQPGDVNVPERLRLLSLALRHADPTMRNLPQRLNPEVSWRDLSGGTNAMRDEYERKFLPDHWVCPFVREKGNGLRATGQIDLKGTAYSTVEWEGRHESYHTWRYEGAVVRGMIPVSGTAGGNSAEVHPNDPREGRPKYSAVSWNRVRPKNNEDTHLLVEPPDGAVPINDPRSKDMCRKWTTGDTRRLRSAGLSSVTAAYCGMGNWLGFPRVIYNQGSHRSGDKGGANVIFADTHVEWVRGSQIGWAK